MDNRRLKILQIVPYFYPAWAYGGIPRVVYELSKELVRRGHEVTVYTTDVLDQVSRCNMSGKEAVVDGIKVRYFRNLSNTMAYAHQVFLPKGFSEAIRNNISGFDIIHLHGHRNILNNIVHYYAGKFNKKYLLSGHGTVPRIERRTGTKVIFDIFFGDRVLRDAEHFIAVSGHEVGQYTAMGIDRKKVSVIYNGIDIDAYSILPEKDSFRLKYGLSGKKIVLFIGKITPRKGVDFLVRAFAGLQTENVFLVIAGNDMGFRGKVEMIIREKSLQDRVLFTGLLTDNEKLAAYQDADVVVYPAIHEIFGLVPFEAIMCGTPVIVTDDCGCGEIIGSQDIGYLVKYNDISALTDLIGKVICNKDEALEKVRKGRKFIMDNLDWERTGNKYLDIYNGVMA
jgi:glycosyltransferase involved in cell wall biosynthesis